MKCVKCRREFDDADGPRASISIFVMGDEYIYTYVYCARCGYYTVESYHDRFMGESEVSFFPPVSKEVGDRAIDLIGACPDPGDKNCECASHKALYYGLP